MLKKINRLPKALFRNEKKISSPAFDLKVRKNGELVSRFGFVVSKRIDKRATVRNKIKRKIRYCIENKLEEIVKGYDFLFIVKKNENLSCDIILSQLKKENLVK